MRPWYSTVTLSVKLWEEILIPIGLNIHRVPVALRAQDVSGVSGIVGVLGIGTGYHFYTMPFTWNKKHFHQFYMSFIKANKINFFGRWEDDFKPFVCNAPFLYPLKTSENRTFFWSFQGVEKGCIGNEWVKYLLEVKILRDII